MIGKNSTFVRFDTALSPLFPKRKKSILQNNLRLVSLKILLCSIFYEGTKKNFSGVSKESLDMLFTFKRTNFHITKKIPTVFSASQWHKKVLFFYEHLIKCCKKSILANSENVMGKNEVHYGNKSQIQFRKWNIWKMKSEWTARALKRYF